MELLETLTENGFTSYVKMPDLDGVPSFEYFRKDWQISFTSNADEMTREYIYQLSVLLHYFPSTNQVKVECLYCYPKPGHKGFKSIGHVHIAPREEPFYLGTSPGETVSDFLCGFGRGEMIEADASSAYQVGREMMEELIKELPEVESGLGEAFGVVG